jgi:ectoine hydroxylase-related dioxygenase (phytanoyl-CoA dioxygenase family)
VNEVLAAFHINESLLTAEQKGQLDEEGYLVFPNAISGEDARSLAARYDEIVAVEGDRAGIEVHQEEGTVRLANLVDKGPMFDVCWAHPLLLASVARVFRRPFKLNSLNGRAALPAEGHQRLHADSDPPVTPGEFQNCNSIWMLDDFTELNGATRIVPGSHLWRERPADVMADPSAARPDEILLLGSAGTLAVFNAHIWHGGTRNRTDRARHGIAAGFVPREAAQQTVQRDYLRPETVRRFTSAQRYLLDV